jgi:hypothetical protein
VPNNRLRTPLVAQAARVAGAMTAKRRWVCRHCGAYLGTYDLQPGSSFERVCHHCRSLCLLEIERDGKVVERYLGRQSVQARDSAQPDTMAAIS